MIQSDLPLHLQYRRDEEVVRAEQNLSNIVDATVRQLSLKNHINPKQFTEHHIMPIFANIVQFFSIQQADLLRYVQTAFLHQMEESGGTDTLVGIPPEDVDSILNELEAIDRFLVKIDNLGGNKKEIVEEIKKEAKTLRTSISDLANVIQELTLEETEESDTDQDFIEFDEDDEEPLIEKDEPLIESEE